MRKKVFLSLSLFIFCILQVWFLYLLINYPSFGINLDKQQDGSWIVSRFDIASNEIGVKQGDKIKSLDGIPPEQFPTVIKLRSVDQVHKLVIERDGHEIQLSTEHVPRVSDSDRFAVLGEVISLLMAYFFYKRLSRSISARYLSLVFLSIGITFMALLASVRGDSFASTMIGTTLMIIPVSFLHFLIAFLKEKADITIKSNFIKYFYGFIALLFVIQLFTFMNSPISYYISEYTTVILQIFVLVTMLLNVWMLGYCLIKYRHRAYVSVLLKTIGASVTISFAPIVCFSFLPKLIYNSYWVDPFYAGWLILFFPVTFAYLISTKQIYDIDFVLKRILFTALISIVPCSLFLSITFFLFPNQMTAKIGLIAFFLYLFTEAIVFYSYEYFTTKLEPIIFPRKYQLQKSLKQIAGNLGAISSFRELKDVVLVDLVNMLDVHGAAIAYKYQQHMEIIAEGDMDEADIQQMLQSEEASLPSHQIFEIHHHETYISYLIVTQKKGNTLLSKEELQWLALIITYLAVCIENVHLVRKLTLKMEQLAASLPDQTDSGNYQWFRKLTFELQEKERARIAADMHDTTMQDLFFLKQRLQNTWEDVRQLTPSFDEYFSNMVDFIDLIHGNLRQCCFELNPHLMNKAGLIKTIERLIQMEAEVADFEISFQPSHREDIESSELDVKIHIFRIIQELMNNAKKHAQASFVRIDLYMERQALVVTYTDDGVGFDPVSLETDNNGLGRIGLLQIKGRVLAFAGNLELHTAPGEGVRIQIVIPTRQRSSYYEQQGYGYYSRRSSVNG